MTYTNVFNPETSFLFYNAVSQQVLSTVMLTPCWCQITFLHLSLSQIFCGAPVISIGPRGRAAYSVLLLQSISNFSRDHSLPQVHQPVQLNPCL